MSVWVEIHCEVGSYETDPENILRFICDTSEGIHPSCMGMTVNTAYKEASKSAREAGWKNKQGIGWVCPGCLKYNK